MKRHTLCVIGGTGFVGRHLAARLARDGHALRIPSRNPERHRGLAVLPRTTLVAADIHDPEALARLFAGCTIVINLVGILNERGHDGRGFRRAHVELPRTIVEACRRAGVNRLLHMSALNAATVAPSFYLRTKGEGEEVAIAAGRNGMAVTRYAPSVIFGTDDSLLNRFTTLLRMTPLLFPLACPEARFAPVHVDNVVEAFVKGVEDPHTIGQRYELCGPQSYTLRQLVAYAATTAGLRRQIIGLPDWLARLQATLFGLLPGKPFSRDNYLSLQVDSLCSHDGLAELGIEPISLESFRPITHGRCHDRYDDYRASARRG